MSEHEPARAPPAPDTVVVRRGSSTAGWWATAVVAIVAIFGVIFVMTRTGPTQDDLQAARNQDPVEARMANATLGAQRSAVSAAQDAKDAATGSARATESVARAAAATSTQAADGTADAGRDVSPTEPDPR